MSSNYGDCVDIYAPSEYISAPSIGTSPYKYSMVSGSSVSAAIIAGIAGLAMNFLQIPLKVLPVDHQSPHYQHLLAAIESPDVNLEIVTMSSLLSSVLYPEDSPIFLRNVLTSMYSSLHQNQTILAHIPSYSPCDYHNPESLLVLLLNSVTYLYKQHQRPPAFLNLKRNLAIHLKQKIEQYYEQEKGWD